MNPPKQQCPTSCTPDGPNLSHLKMSHCSAHPLSVMMGGLNTKGLEHGNDMPANRYVVRVREGQWRRSFRVCARKPSLMNASN